MRRSWWKLRRLKAANRLQRTETASGDTKSSLHFEASEVQAAFACIKSVEKLNVIVRGYWSNGSVAKPCQPIQKAACIRQSAHPQYSKCGCGKVRAAVPARFPCPIGPHCAKYPPANRPIWPATPAPIKVHSSNAKVRETCRPAVFDTGGKSRSGAGFHPAIGAMDGKCRLRPFLRAAASDGSPAASTTSISVPQW